MLNTAHPEWRSREGTALPKTSSVLFYKICSLAASPLGTISDGLQNFIKEYKIEILETALKECSIENLNFILKVYIIQ